MSQMDIKVCLALDFTSLCECGASNQIEELHNCLKAVYGMEIERM